MTGNDDPSTIKGTARAALRAANPDRFAHAQGKPDTAGRLAAIERRAQAVSDRLRAHLERFEESWTAREAIRLWRRRAVLAARHPAPAGARQPALEPTALMRDARRQVRARATRRLSSVSAIKTGMQNAVLRTDPRMMPQAVLTAGTNPETRRKNYSLE